MAGESPHPRFLEVDVCVLIGWASALRGRAASCLRTLASCVDEGIEQPCKCAGRSELTVCTPMYCLTPKTVAVAPAPTIRVAMLNAFKQWRAPLKLSSGFVATEEVVVDVDGTGSLIENTGGFVVGFAIGMPLVRVRRGGGGGALASALPRVAARCRRNITMGTTSAADENASYHGLE